jgi:hypothetical protein
LGLVIIFGSWITENMLVHKWESRLDDQDFFLSMVNVTTGHQDVMEVGADLLRNSYEKNKNDSSAKFTYAKYLMQFSGDVAAFRLNEAELLNINSDKYKDDTLTHRVFHETQNKEISLSNLTAKPDIAQLEVEFNNAISYMSSDVSRDNRNEIFAYRRTLKGNIDNSRWIFLGLYIIGSLLLAVSYFLNYGFK